MVYVRGGSGQKKPRIQAKGKVTWLECPKDDLVIDRDKGQFKLLKMSVMLKQGETKEDTEMLYLALGNVDFQKKEFAQVKKIDGLLGSGPEDRKYPIIEFEYYTSETTAKDEKGEVVYEDVQREIKGEMKTVLQAKVYKNARMSAKDCEGINIIAEDSDAPIWHTDDQGESKENKEEKTPAEPESDEEETVEEEVIQENFSEGKLQ